jgi:hypothetical protein
MNIRPIFPILLCTALSACWQMQRENMVRTVSAPDAQLCLIDAGIEPATVRDCIAYAENKPAAMSNVADQLHLDPEKKLALRRCALEVDQARLARQHTTTCYQGFFGSVTCNTQ